MNVEVKMINSYTMEVIVGQQTNLYNIKTCTIDYIIDTSLKSSIKNSVNRIYGLDVSKISQEIKQKVEHAYYTELYSAYRDAPKPSKSQSDFELKLSELQKCIDVAKQDLIKGIEIYKLLHGIGVTSSPYTITNSGITGLTGIYNGASVMNCNTNLGK